MYVGLAIFVFVVVGGVSYLIRVPFFSFAKAIREPFLIAFTTASSEAALPKALEVMERFGVPKNIVSFVLPTGYSFNLDGTTLYLSLASVFVAQLAGVSMPFGQQLFLMLTLMVTSKGVAGVPRAALVVLTATLTQFGLPLEGAAILLGIDQIMDMGRTAVNVMGNCIATAVVARWEGVFDDARMRAFAVDSTSGQPDADCRAWRPGPAGAAIVHECRPVHEVTAFTAPIWTSPTAAVAAAMDRARPQVIINCAGCIHEVDGAEDHPIEALSGNAFSVRRWRAAPTARDAGPLQHRFRFRRRRVGPYSVHDPANPRGVCLPRPSCSAEWFAADAPARLRAAGGEPFFGAAGDGRRKAAWR
jgi:hypothetical protein